MIASRWLSEDDLDAACTNEGSSAAWAAWPTMPRNPYQRGTPEHDAWASGARASHAARGDADYCPAWHPHQADMFAEIVRQVAANG